MEMWPERQERNTATGVNGPGSGVTLTGLWIPVLQFTAHVTLGKILNLDLSAEPLQRSGNKQMKKNTYPNA